MSAKARRLDIEQTTVRGYKSGAKPKPEELLQQIQTRMENVRNGSDDALLEESELLSRGRDEKLNALAVKDGGGGGANKAKGTTNRTSIEAQRKAICDEFEEERSKVRKRMLQELTEETKRIKEEIQASKEKQSVGREKRKTTRGRGDLDSGGAGVGSVNTMLARLTELESKVILNKDELDDDLDAIRCTKDGAKGKGGGGGATGGSAAGGTAGRGGPAGRSGAGGRKPGRWGAASQEGVNRVHSSKGVLVVNEQRYAKGDAARVSEAGGEVVGHLSSCNSLEVRFQVQGRAGLYKVYLASIRTGLTSVERPNGSGRHAS